MDFGRLLIATILIIAGFMDLLEPKGHDQHINHDISAHFSSLDNSSEAQENVDHLIVYEKQNFNEEHDHSAHQCHFGHCGLIILNTINISYNIEVEMRFAFLSSKIDAPILGLFRPPII